jgi:hypothetical protein
MGIVSVPSGEEYLCEKWIKILVATGPGCAILGEWRSER